MATAVVVGCGDISVVHLQAIEETAGAELVGVCDIDPATAAATAERHGVRAFTDHRRLLTELRPDVVHVCTPHDQHVPVALDSLDAGAHVLLEKPLAHTAAAGQEIVDAAARHPLLKIGICFQNRYNSTSLAVRRLLDSGSLGRVLGASGTVQWRRTPAYYRSRPWRGQRARSGGGVLINQAIHTLDLMQWLVGDITVVRGEAAHLGWDTPFIDVDDTATLVLEHLGGARSIIFATNLNATDSPVTVEITTERAVLYLRGDLTISYADGRTETVREDARAGESLGRSYWGASHQALIEDFYARLAEPDPFWIGPVEAMKTLRTLDQVYSGDAARVVVDPLRAG